MKFLRSIFVLLIIAGVTWFFIQPASSQTAPTSVNSFYNVRYGNVGIGTVGAGQAAGTYVTIYTAPTAGAMLKGLTASNVDTTTDHVITCRIVNGSSTVGAQFFGTATHASTPLNLLASTNFPGLPIDQWGNPFQYLPSGYTVQCTYTTALTNNYVAIDAQAGEF